MVDADSGEVYGKIDVDYCDDLESCIPLPDGKHWIELTEDDVDYVNGKIKVRLWEYTIGDEEDPSVVCKHCGTLCTHEAFFHEHEACPECESILFVESITTHHCRDCGSVLNPHEMDSGDICINCSAEKALRTRNVV